MRIIFFLLLFIAFHFTACKKGSCVHGVVTDSKTGLPIADVALMMTYQYSETGSFKLKVPDARTDAAGEFSFSAGEKSSETIHFKNIFKAGYSNVYELERDPDKGCDEVKIRLVPLDGLVKLSITNTTGTHDSIYARFLNKYEYEAHLYYSGSSPTKPYPLILQKGETFTQVFGGIAGDTSTIFWKFTENGPWFDTDSVLVKAADTTFFEIAY